MVVRKRAVRTKDARAPNKEINRRQGDLRLDELLEANALAALGGEAVDMLCRGDIDGLASRYGYGLSYGRDAAAAIRDDLRRCLSQAGATSLTPASPNPVRSVAYYDSTGTGILAVVECLAPTDNGVSLLVELVVTSKGKERHITLEQISADGLDSYNDT